MVYKAELINSNEGAFYFIQIGSKLNNEANIKKSKAYLEGFEIKYK